MQDACKQHINGEWEKHGMTLCIVGMQPTFMFLVTNFSTFYMDHFQPPLTFPHSVHHINDKLRMHAWHLTGHHILPVILPISDGHNCMHGIMCMKEA